MLGPLLLPWTWPFFCHTTRTKANLILINGWSGKKIPSYGDSKNRARKRKKRKEKEERRGEERRGEKRRKENRRGSKETRRGEEPRGEERDDKRRGDRIDFSWQAQYLVMFGRQFSRQAPCLVMFGASLFVAGAISELKAHGSLIVSCGPLAVQNVRCILLPSCTILSAKFCAAKWTLHAFKSFAPHFCQVSYILLIHASVMGKDIQP